MYQSKEVKERLNAMQICERRNEIIVNITKACEALSNAEHLLKTISKYGYSIDRNTFFQIGDEGRKLDAIKNLTKQTDKVFWDHIIKLGQFRDLMCAKDRDELNEQLQDTPELTYDTVTATFAGLLNNRSSLLQNLVKQSFLDRDKAYKSNTGNRVNKKQVLANIYDGYGFYSTCTAQAFRFEDITKAISLLLATDEPHVSGNLKRGKELLEFNGKVKYKAFKNGNVHITILDEDLLNKLNMVLAGEFKNQIGE